MRQLTPCCIAAGVTPIENIEYDIFASLPPEEQEPTSGVVYGVPRDLSSSGRALLVGYRFTDVRDMLNKWSFEHCFWALYLRSIPGPAEDPADPDYMKEISS
ncbi:hypothetical protein LCGC14_1135830 [marine sediment metagenome]|uniref:Uncharacterized protein n=1 Tax=marine sediment metagenome TaxID=412755 RepID=A0A0F9Q5F7_9ZZZZ